MLLPFSERSHFHLLIHTALSAIIISDFLAHVITVPVSREMSLATWGYGNPSTLL